MTITNKPNWKLTAGITLLIFLLCYLLTLSSTFKSNPEILSNVIVIALLIIVPLAYYLLIRKSSVSKLTVFGIFFAGMLIAGWILNGNSNALLQFIRTWIVPVIELTVIIFVIRKFYIANKKAKQSGKDNVDFLAHCRLVMYEVTGSEKAGNIIASEIGTLYYVFIGRKVKNIDNLSKFTSYKENGILLILGTILVLFFIETTGVHFLLKMWNSTAAWVVTVLSLYTCLQLFAHIRAVKARPVTLGDRSLEIYNGLAGDAFIRYDNIDKVELSDRIPDDRNWVKISLLTGLEKHNCIIYLKQPIQVTKIFGIIKKTDTILFYADRKQDFNNALKGKLISARTIFLVN